jgi:hypothetical protein
MIARTPCAMRMGRVSVANEVGIFAVVGGVELI